MSMDPTLFTRDGHLQDLALERLAIDDLEPAAAETVRAHLQGCQACTQRRGAIAAELAEPLPELRTAPAPERRGGFVIPAGIMRLRWFVGGVGAAVAAAAVALVVMLPAIDEELGTGFRARGSALSFEVYRQADAGAVRVQDGDGVQAGDRLGFRVASQDGGHLIVLGIDSALSPYPCYPADPARGPVAWAASPDPVRLDAAVELDATPGQERIVALLCERPVGFEELAPQLRAAASGAEAWDALPDLHTGCLQRELRVHKLQGAP